ncbi:Dual specificity phosphatase, catalytic domain [Desulfacinum hydrothermale DSM 13146]|uniref:Dual specificity phosphatase, catalytic domain n=1 Tax=Desulfacinum hydrothermale DSM 13146 TaxID=1121390 RepID=A0A1W1X1K9_9BACT|nr:dual specificity protein phosphatase family protein [Desulfacinum hydrothermale]SMC17795.1 Dual specificity phosphatase, catalytic domain [Desulfacinum hydrothermale DSM 13146]
MSDYEIRWITDQLAVGHAPMSYRHLDEIRAQGITAIVNLCGEYCDLHELEEGHGFEVYYLPIPDERAPDLAELEKALDWLDESVYLGKKVLVHCRFGIGRTGTFVTSYLLRCGFGIKSAKKRLKQIRSSPTSFSQWRMLRKVGKQEKQLTVREPSLEGKHVLDLAPYFADYRELARQADVTFRRQAERSPGLLVCGTETATCCGRLLFLQFIEAAYLSHTMNKVLTREQRLAAVERAVECSRRFSSGPVKSTDNARGLIPAAAPEATEYGVPAPPGPNEDAYRCPLSVEDRCILFDHRPLACRLFGLEDANRGENLNPAEGLSPAQSRTLLYRISQDLFFALNGVFIEGRSLLFPLPHVVSGKFIQDYFGFLKTTGT